jgi:nitronate monooxygenase
MAVREAGRMLRTFLTTEWGLRYPVLNAPMAPFAGGALARAVSDAGGLGMMSLDYRDDLAAFEAQVALAREGEDARRFGIGLTAWSLALRPELLDAAIAARPFLISISFGDLAPFAQRVRTAGIRLAAQVQNRASALAAVGVGADTIVAQGTEAGGHTGEVGTLPLLQIVLDAVRDRPVVAAGGIASARGVAAVLAAGAEGAWVGTPFLLAEEARVPDAARDRVIEADETQTVLTSVYDRVQHIPWPATFRGRALANAFTERWDGNEDELMRDERAQAEFADAKSAGRYDVAYVYAGQSVGMLNKRRPAREIVLELADGAEQSLRSRLIEILD